MEPPDSDFRICLVFRRLDVKKPQAPAVNKSAMLWISPV